ncbi:MAG TPA: peroxidase family protein [Polyangiaceae bacterium]|nr:peroxidase family protein [Polyangiaceae bacterium]
MAPTSPASLRQAVIERMEQHEFHEAVVLSRRLVAVDDTADNHALLGTAYLLAQRYPDARASLDHALSLGPASDEWKAKRDQARANIESDVCDPRYPPVVPFDRAALLAAPHVPPGAIPPDPFDATILTLGEQIRARAGEAFGAAAGAVCTVAMDVLTALLRRTGPDDPVWTTWYRKRSLPAFATLVHMRNLLETNNLVDPYPDGVLTAFQSHGLVPPSGVRHFRTADGSWNNLSNPKEGAANVRFPRNVSRRASWPETGARLLTPNPVEISHVLLSRGPDGIKEVPFLNMLAACWIQFMVHDWVSHHTVSHTIDHHTIDPDGFYELPVPDGHPARTLYHQIKLCVPKTEGDPTRSPGDRGSPPTAINESTSWWDASQIYGSDQRTADSLRAFNDGKLLLYWNQLPLHPTGRIEQSGFNRNWWFGLALMHLLFVYEHNAICDMLKRHHPVWDDSRLYNVARLVNAAVIAKIHTIEWTPAILPNRSLNFAMHTNWYGALETFFRRKDRKVLRWGKIRHPEIGGLVGNLTCRHGKPYGLSEEFTEIYRMHELLPDTLVIRSRRTNLLLEEVPLAHTRHRSAREITTRYELEDLFFSLGNQHPGQLVLNNYPGTLQQVSIPGSHVLDLGAVDILRARERGVPRYNELRRQLGLKPIRTFEDLTTDPVQVCALRTMYDDDVELVDMHVGTRAESHRPTGFGFGETLFQVFILNASRRLQADRFFTESYREETYTKEGLQWIDAADFKSVLLRHFPDLGATGLGFVDNAFEPWDTGELTLERHPLRAFA